jgi:shikimate kinase
MGTASRERSLLLAGMMGAGKTSVGRLLAQRLGWAFVDSDACVEQTQSRPIREIFALEGEARFRALEREALETLPASQAVVALGGGAVVDPATRKLLRAKGTLVWLDASPEALAKRLGAAGERPLLADLDGPERIERLRQLRAERAVAYADSDLRVDTEGLSPEQVCAAVLCGLGWEDAA